jgi:hypothetical protein
MGRIRDIYSPPLDPDQTWGPPDFYSVRTNKHLRAKQAEQEADHTKRLRLAQYTFIAWSEIYVPMQEKYFCIYFQQFLFLW